jgi:hypothetical protein
MKTRKATYDDCARIGRNPPLVLCQHPDIISTGWGCKIEGGRITSKVAVWVCVRKKYPAKELPVSRLIPKEITLELDGQLVRVPLDVVELPEVKLGQGPFCDARDDMVRPVAGGYACAPEYAEGSGTIGTKVWATDVQKDAIFSCAHVLTDAFNPNASVIILQPPGWEDKEAVIGHVDRIGPIYAENVNPWDCGRALLLVEGQRWLPCGYYLKEYADFGWVNSQMANLPDHKVPCFVDGAGSCTVSGFGFAFANVVVTPVRGYQASLMFGPVLVTTPLATRGDSGAILFYADNPNITGKLGIGYAHSAALVNGITVSVHLDLALAFKQLFLEPPRPDPGEATTGPGSCAILDAEFLNPEERGTLYHLHRLVGGTGEFGRKMLKFTSALNTEAVKIHLAQREDIYHYVVGNLVTLARGAKKITEKDARTALNLLQDVFKLRDEPKLLEASEEMMHFVKASVGFDLKRLLQAIRERNIPEKMQREFEK